MRLDVSNLLKILLSILIIYLCFLSLDYIKVIINYLIGILIPFIIGFGISFILQPIINYLKRRGMNKKIAILLTLSFLLIIVLSFCIFLVPIISEQLSIFLSRLPDYLEIIKNKLNDMEQKFIVLDHFGLSLDKLIKSFTNYQGNIMSKMINFIESIFSYFIPIITTPVLIIYFTIYYEEIEQIIVKKTKNKKVLFNILKKCKQSMRLYFKSVLIIVSLLSLLSSIALGILGIEYFVLWGIIIGITDIIPYVGPYIGGSLVLLFILTTKPNLFVYAIIIICVVQLIEECLLTPKIQGKAMQINPILVIFSLALFGKILGIFGMIIAVPIVRIFQIILTEIISYKKDLNKS